MDTPALSLMLWERHAGVIREAYLDSEKSIALVLVQPGDVRIAPLEMWEGAYTNPETSFGLVEKALDECREIHRGKGGVLPAVYFAVLADGEWTGEAMTLAFMSRGGIA